MTKLRIAVVGLGFGADFAPIYQAHPDVEEVVICDPDAARLNEIGDRFAIARRLNSLDEVLSSDCDAVHLLTPVPDHVEHTLRVLKAGKHCACAVPMAMTIDDLWRIIGAQESSGCGYMMMETGVYTRNFLYAQDLIQRGELGTLTFLRGAYFQDIEGDYPDYWRAQPPMHYATHAVAPILALAQTRATQVNCRGSGRLRADIQQSGGNTFPLQTAIFALERDGLAAEVTHSWFQTARAYAETFSVYGDAQGFEWSLEHEAPLLFTLQPLRAKQRGRDAETTQIAVPFYGERLPHEIRRFAQGGHGGSHPHLIHEWVRSIIENRPALIDARTAANWCAPGICAHQSSLQNGAIVDIPDFGA